MSMATLSTLAIPFVLVLTRLSGLLLGLPFIVPEVAPRRVRAAVLVVLTVVIGSVAPAEPNPGFVMGAMVTEFMLGLAMGLVVRLALLAAEFAADVAGHQLGFGFSATVDPLTDNPAGPLTRLVSALTGLVFFTSEGHHAVIKGLVSSFYVLPAGGGEMNRVWMASFLTERTGDVFKAGMRVAAPLVLTTFATQLTFGLLTRAAPGLNLWAIGFMAVIGVGLVALTVFAPTLVTEMQSLLRVGLDDLALAVGS